jgi:hypothetical protein
MPFMMFQSAHTSPLRRNRVCIGQFTAGAAKVAIAEVQVPLEMAWNGRYEQRLKTSCSAYGMPTKQGAYVQYFSSPHMYEKEIFKSNRNSAKGSLHVRNFCIYTHKI